MSKELIGALSKALNVAESEVSSTLFDGDKIKDGAGKFIEDKFSAHVAKLNEDAEAKRKRDLEQAEGKFTKQTAEKFEKAISDAIPGIDKTLKGNDLLNAIPEAVKKITNIQTEPDKIKASETFIQGVREAEERVKKDYEGRITEKETALNDLKSNIEKEKVSNAVKAAARKFEDSLTLRTDIPAETIQALKATAQAALLSNNQFKVLENGEIVLIDEKGELRKDAHGHSLKLDSVITDAYKPLDGLKTAAKAKGDGGGGGGAGGGAGDTVTIESLGLSAPKNMEEYNVFLSSANKLKGEGKLGQSQFNAILGEADKAMLEAVEAK
jgi:hypothetical protein